MKTLVSLFFACISICFGNEFLIDFPESEQKIEILIQKKESNAPLIIFLHGASQDGCMSISQSVFDHWLDKNYSVAAISMPGYGKSSGKKDFCGPLTINSLHFAIDMIQKETNVSTFAIIGFGQGALAGALLATERDDLSCIVCANGGYDLLRHDPDTDTLMNLLVEKGYDLNVHRQDDLLLRSPIYQTFVIKAPMFLIHRKGCQNVSEMEVEDFQKAMLRAGKECQLSFKDRTELNHTDKISIEEILEEAEDWIDGHCK